MSKREPHLYLQDIKDSVANIEEYTKDLTFDYFEKDHKTVDAVVRNLSIIGEAVKNLPEEIKLQYPDIPWHEIMGMRNKVIHEYFAVIEDTLWKTIKEDLPVFKEQINSIKL
jgi:uncharacterized protein with HEPN domain